MNDQEEMRAIFAGLAMNGLIHASSPHADDLVEHIGIDHKISYAESIARDAVIHADALIRALGYDLVSR